MMSSLKNVSFGFAKRIESKSLSDSVLREENTKEESNETDYVNLLYHKKIQSSIKPNKGPIVIPLLNSKWQESLDKLALKRIEVKKEVEQYDMPKTLDELAALELLKESRNEMDDVEPEEKKLLPDTFAIKVEKEDKLELNTEDLGDEPTIDDYNEVPIEEFGLAMLRGMGWNPKEGIGLTRKQIVEPIEAVMRPKGLGLGASIHTKLKAKSLSKNENLELIKGAYIVVQEGPNKMLYGQVESLDDETSRVLVKMALSNEVLNLSQYNVEVVSKEEFKKYGKVLNKSKYEKYKKYSEKKLRKAKEEANSSSHRRSRSRSPSNINYSSGTASEDKDGFENWLRPHLRVRLVDSKYKKGKYYKSKLVVEDVVAHNNCTCRSDEGTLLEKITHSMVETVIPKDERSYVMILRGCNKGEIGRVLERDRKRCIAHVQLLNDDCKLTKYDYDNICEYTGDIAAQGY